MIQQDGNNHLIHSGLIGEWRFNEGAGQQVFNRVAANQTPTTNIYGMPEQTFDAGANSLSAWNKGGFTVTEGAGANPIDGANTATRMVCAAGDVQLTQAISIAAGTYTMSIYAKSNTGVNQKIRFCYVAGSRVNSADQTVTTSWQQFSFTFTAGAAITNIVALNTDAAGEALDILIYGPQLQSGSSATAYIPTQGHLQLGRYLATDTGDPTWFSGGLTFGPAAGKDCRCVLPQLYSMSRITVYCVAKWNGNGSLSGYNPLVGEDYAQPRFNLAMNDVNQVRFKFNGTNADARNVTPNDGSYHLWTGIYDGTNVRYFLDDMEVWSTPASLAAVNVLRLFVGQINAAGWLNGNISYILLYNKAHTQAQVRQTLNVLQNIMVKRSITVQPLPKFGCFEGDSITDPTIIGLYPVLTLQSMTPIMQGRNFALSGSSMVQLQARAAQVDATFNPRGLRILSIFIGANDGGDGDVTFYNNLKASCLARRATGWKTVVLTLLPQSTSHNPFNTFRNSVNSMIYADHSWCDAIADVASDATFGTDAAANNTTYYSDGLHPTSTTHNLMAPYVEAAFHAVGA